MAPVFASKSEYEVASLLASPSILENQPTIQFIGNAISAYANRSLRPEETITPHNFAQRSIVIPTLPAGIGAATSNSHSGPLTIFIGNVNYTVN